METQQPKTIAIDGPGASGKNTVGMLLAQQLGYPFIDSGAMYRAVTLKAMAEDVDPDDQDALPHLARSLTFRFLPPTEGDPAGRLLVDGADVTDQIHAPAVDARVSRVARIPAVREVLVMQQRTLAEIGPVIMVGRDIGTVVLPDADLKVYLDASASERAHRRFRELRDRGEDVSFEQVLGDLMQRDLIDQERAASPLRPAEDAVMLNTDGLTPQDVAEAVTALFDGCKARA